MSAISCTVAPVVAQASVAKASSTASAPVAAVPRGIKAAALFTKAQTSPFVSNGHNTTAMLVWTPENNRFFETFSYLPPLSDMDIAKQVDYMIRIGATPCLEFAVGEQNALTDTHCKGTGIDSRSYAGYYDNRYWSMWKLPMYGCNNGQEVMREVMACKSAFPQAYIRVCGFDNVQQVQVVSFLVSRPTPAIPTQARSV